jgi:hypothetical protein
LDAEAQRLGVVLQAGPDATSIMISQPLSLKYSLPAMINAVFAGDEYGSQMKREAGLWIALLAAQPDHDTLLKQRSVLPPPYSLVWDKHRHERLVLLKGYSSYREPGMPTQPKSVFLSDPHYGFLKCGKREWLVLDVSALQETYQHSLRASSRVSGSPTAAAARGRRASPTMVRTGSPVRGASLAMRASHDGAGDADSSGGGGASNGGNGAFPRGRIMPSPSPMRALGRSASPFFPSSQQPGQSLR